MALRLAIRSRTAGVFGYNLRLFFKGTSSKKLHLKFYYSVTIRHANIKNGES